MSRYTEIETATHNAYEDYLYENSQDFANGIGIGFRREALSGQIKQCLIRFMNG